MPTTAQSIPFLVFTLFNLSARHAIFDHSLPPRKSFSLGFQKKLLFCYTAAAGRPPLLAVPSRRQTCCSTQSSDLASSRTTLLPGVLFSFMALNPTTGWSLPNIHLQPRPLARAPDVNIQLPTWCSAFGCLKPKLLMFPVSHYSCIDFTLQILPQVFRF